MKDIVTVDNFLDKEDFFNLREIAYSDSLHWKKQVSDGTLSRFTSFERVQLRDLTVIKKDGKSPLVYFVKYSVKSIFVISKL